MKTTISLILLLIVSSAFAYQPATNYYSPKLIAQIKEHSLKDEALKIALFDVISSNQVTLGYDGARRVMFGQMYLNNDSNGNFITDVYCQKRFGAASGVGSNQIPDGTKINCEHTWPQSKFTGAFSRDTQKSDLHHLFPSDSKANSRRGNDPFTDVSHDTGDLSQDNCSVSKFGSSATGGNDGFEPPLTHKGNVARAIFYFAVRYKMAINKYEEETLRRWNDLDPVDQAEIDKNNKIEQAQRNRNPFIDFPGLANDINKF